MKKVEDFYPITTKVYPPNNGDEQGKKVYITDKDLKNYTKPAEYANLERYLTGSTRYMEGTFLTDVEGWLNNHPNLD